MTVVANPPAKDFTFAIFRGARHREGSLADNSVIVAALEEQGIDKRERIAAIKTALVERP